MFPYEHQCIYLVRHKSVIIFWMKNVLTKKFLMLFRICHINAILNGVAGIVVFSAPSALSAAWFPPRERTTATGIALVFNNLGNAASFLMAPHIVEDPHNTTHGPGENFTCPILPLDEIRRIKNEIAILMYVGKFDISFQLLRIQR